MTHSLHRRGDTAADKDFVWFMYQSKGINDVNIEEKAKRFIAVVEDVGSANWGDVKTGPTVRYDKQEIIDKISQKSRLRGVFTSKQKVVQFLEEIREEDVGLSVIVTGYIDTIIEAAKEAGVKPHTINFSLGIFGKTEKLPDENTLQITTMCGHHMVPDDLVQRKRKEVKEGKITADEAAEELATYCPCGIFNQVRASEILKLDKAVENE